MASLIQIWNMSLSMLGTRARISDPEENSTESQQCSVWFEPARDATRRAFDWNFARRYLLLSERSDITLPSNWRVAYSYPSDCIRFRGILPDMVPPTQFKVSSALDANSNVVRVIFANVAQAEGWYTARIEDTELFDPGFVCAMAAVLAAHVALPITQKESIAQAMGKRAELEVMRAAADDANEGVNQIQHFTPEELSARGFNADDDGAA